MTKKVIVAHGDLDGIISAVCLALKLGLTAAEVNVIFVQPFTLDKVVIPEEVVNEVFVVDVAINNRDPLMTKNFIDKFRGRLKAWYDHHAGWERMALYGAAFFSIRFEIKEDAGSTAEIIGGPAELVADATAADTRQGVLSERAELIEQATKANLSDDSIRQMAVKWLLGDESARSGLEIAAEKYAAIQAETERLVATYRVNGKVALVDARKSNHQYDLTQLLLAGQKLAEVAVAQTVHPQLGEGLAIATSRKDVNLVEVFNLNSGAPFRVSLPAARLEEALAKLATV